jgi:hypothetical protein
MRLLEIELFASLDLRDCHLVRTKEEHRFMVGTIGIY